MRTPLTNISHRGRRLMAQDVPAIGELLRIDVPRVGSIAATIRRTSNAGAGSEPIPLSDIREKVLQSSN